MEPITVLIINVATTLALTGLIWMVQVVHYPLFSKVGHVGFAQYHRAHTRLITWIVGPLMLGEAWSAWWLLRQPISPIPGWMFDAAFSLLIIVWGSTVMFQIPLHRTLSVQFQRRAYERLVLTNWMRTLAWTGRTVLVVVGLALVLEPALRC